MHSPRSGSLPHAGPMALCVAGYKDSNEMDAARLEVYSTNPTANTVVQDFSSISGSIIFSDVAWSPGHNDQPVPAGLGIFLQIAGVRPYSKISISAISLSVSSSIQAEAFDLLFGVKLADFLHIEQATFLTDNATLATVAAARDLLTRYWAIRPQLADIIASSSFNGSKFLHISRCLNFRAHPQDKLGLKLQSTPLTFRCLNSGKGVGDI